MPRPNQPRSIASEQGLARRIAHEREARRWSYEGLASRMTQVGCPIQASAIYKIEKSDPPRRITVDELVAFSEVFATPVENLLLPPDVVAKEELVNLLVDWEVARGKAHVANEEEDMAWTALRKYVDEHGDITPTLEAAMTSWAEHYYDQEKQSAAVSYWMWKMTESNEWAKRMRADLAERHPELWQA